jgi:hypothetical protein
MGPSRFALLVAFLLALTPTAADARGGGRGGDRACNPNATFEHCMDKCAARQGGIGDNKDHNKCAKKCSRRVCTS